MLFMLKKRYDCYRRRVYYNQVKKYLGNHSFEIVQHIYNGSLNGYELTEHGIQNTLVDGYPVAPWVDKEDIIGQFVALLEEIGCSFSYEDGKYYLKCENLNSKIIKNYLKINGPNILERLSKYCEKWKGRITYFQAQKVLGVNCSKPAHVNKVNIKECIILFFIETGIPLKFDDQYLYFP